MDGSAGRVKNITAQGNRAARRPTLRIAWSLHGIASLEQDEQRQQHEEGHPVENRERDPDLIPLDEPPGTRKRIAPDLDRCAMEATVDEKVGRTRRARLVQVDDPRRGV